MKIRATSPSRKHGIRDRVRRLEITVEKPAQQQLLAALYLWLVEEKEYPLLERWEDQVVNDLRRRGLLIEEEAVR